MVENVPIIVDGERKFLFTGATAALGSSFDFNFFGLRSITSTLNIVGGRLCFISKYEYSIQIFTT